MRKLNVAIEILMLCLSWLGCYRDGTSKQQVKIEEIAPDSQPEVYRLVKEAEAPLETGGYAFMPVRSDTAVYLRYRLYQNEIKLLKYDFNLSLVTSHSFMYGQGPGEWVNLQEFVGFEDAILMTDRAQDRITWFDSHMNIVNTIRPRLGIQCSSIQGEMVRKGKGRYGFYYMTVTHFSGEKQGYYAGKAYRIYGGEISPSGLDCKLYHEALRMSQKGQAPIYEVGPKLYFAMAGDILYAVDAETYTLTRIDLTGVPVRSVRMKTDFPEFSKVILQKWEKGFSSGKKDPHAGMWNPTWWYPSPLMPVAGVVVLGQGLAVISCENYDPENKPNMIKADYFDLELNPLGVVHFPYFTYWNCPMAWESSKVHRIFYWHEDRLFYINDNDEDHPTLSRWRLEGPESAVSRQ